MSARRAPLSRRAFLGAAAGACAVLSRRGDAAPARPNILLVCADQQHGRALGFMDPFFDTPALDRLAREGGRVFTEAFCTTPQCSPSRATLYTGFYPHRANVPGNLDVRRHDGGVVEDMAPKYPTVGKLLGDTGYHTGYFGKWHLGNTDTFAAQFDEADLDGDAASGATAKATTFLEARAADPEKPFALFVNYINPHDIYEASKRIPSGAAPPEGPPVPHPASWAETFAGKPPCQGQFMREDQGKFIHGRPDADWEHYRLIYREKCRLLDREVGALLDTLDRLGLAGNTLVLFTADHGDMDTHHRLVFKGPFMYDQLIRVPLLLRMPGAAGKESGALTEPMSLADVVPTLCDAAGVPFSGDGRSLLPLLNGEKPPAPRDGVVVQYYGKQQWVNPARTLRAKDWKYTRWVGQGEELYDLCNDPDELRNLADDPAHAATRDTLLARLDDWMSRHDDTAFEESWPTDRQRRRLQ